MLTLLQMFEESVSKFPQNPLLWDKKTNKYKSITFSETHQLVYQFAAGLAKLGIQKGDRIALISEGRSEWVISELGMLYNGAVNVPLSVKLSEPSEILFRIEHSGARMIIASQNQIKKIQAVRDKLLKVEKIIILDKQVSYNDNEISYDEILNIGKAYLQERNSIVEDLKNSVYPDDYAAICYTSGTTSDPKGIILTHRNFTANIQQSLSLMDVPSHFVTLLILPWDHSFAHTCGIYTVMSTGASLASVQSGKSPMEALKNIPINIKEIRPHFIMSVPALAKNFKKNIENGINAKGPVVKFLFSLGLKTAHIYNRNGFDKGKGWRFLLKPVLKIFDTIIFSKVREGFGGRLEFFVGGGALLDIELQRFFYAIGIPMMQGYGLTEASPVISSNALKKHKLGSSGKVASFLEIKICDEKGNSLKSLEKGEIVIQGENVMAGYWQNREATSQVIIDGYLHTGDMGYLDNDGFLYVLGRFKSLLIGDDGEKFSPEGIEEAFVAQSSYIDQCMLYNNQNPYTVAIIVPNKEAIKRWLTEKHHHHNVLESNNIESALKLIESEIIEYRTGRKYGNMFPQRWLPSSIAIIDEPFTEENQLINSTLKLVRGKVVEKYQPRIEFLYTPEAKNILNKLNYNALSKMLEIF